MSNMTQAFILLLAGFVVVFVVLILLIIIVTLYGKIITTIQNKGKKKKEKKLTEKEEPSETVPKVNAVSETEEMDDGEIPGEIIAVIAAAVDAVYGTKPHKIKSVKKSRNVRSAWSRAGVLDNTRPF